MKTINKIFKEVLHHITEAERYILIVEFKNADLKYNNES